MTGVTFAGFDASAYPGDAAMAALKADTNLAFTGFYIAPAPSHHEIGWMDKRATLVAMGWGIAPIYVGQQIIGPGSRNVSAAQGTIDGGDAAGLMLEAGFPDLSVCFLDLENGPPFHGAQISYVQMWCAALKLGRYTPGVYCSHAIAEDVHAATDARIWAFRVQTVTDHQAVGSVFPDPDPSGCGYDGAVIWQREQNCIVNAGGRSLLIDLNTSLMADPSAPP